MFIESNSDQRQAILASMCQVATSQGVLPLTEIDHISLEAVNHYVFRATDALDTEGR